MKPRSALALAVVVVGLVIGAVIVGRPVSVPNDIVLDPAVATTTSVATTEAPTITDPPVEATVATQSSLAPSELDARVVVVNASALGGVATTNAALLTAAGFTEVSVGDAPVEPLSAVYLRAGFEGSGLLVAEALGLSIDAIQSLPSVPVTASDAEADVLVLIGADWTGEQ